jgi:hypothetical protein
MMGNAARASEPVVKRSIQVNGTELLDGAIVHSKKTDGNWHDSERHRDRRLNGESNGKILYRVTIAIRACYDPRFEILLEANLTAVFLTQSDQLFDGAQAACGQVRR